MLQEVERKFLVKGEFKSRAYAHHRMTQGYICSEQGRTVRVRISEHKGFLTIKGPSDDSGITRFEWEKELPLPEAEALMELCLPGKIDKTRYLVQEGDHIFEIDEFHGENAGLQVAEIELRHADEPFTKPDFLGKEVTGDRRYYNSELMKNPFSNWL